MVRIIFCTTIKNRFSNLRRLISSLCEMSDSDFALSVADFSSDDGDIPGLLRDSKLNEYYYTKIAGRYFNRSEGLNFAARNTRAGPDEILFFIDVDMLVPTDFCQRIRSNVRKGHAWFPVCYSLHKDKPVGIHHDSRNPNAANGWWRTEGTGMAGFTYSDFEALGGWNEEIGITYGEEDGDIFRRAGKVLKVARGRCVGLFHVWHPTGDFRTKYHRPASDKEQRPARVVVEHFKR